ncbi:Mu-like prophage FluMu protein gp28 [Klebsiella pneumoniae]|uniref:Mu-like prophage FluMu protein gp28 n=1 Tax=Klebsiella pneumoniae TaxID=573 RepID=A0A2X3D5A4_KLEPN|nr:Mu-like prophage FluMu protein gp28 [Klebsiella pneumoniae]
MVTVSREQELLRSQSASAILAGEFDADQVLLPYQRRWIADPAQLKIGRKITPYRADVGGGGRGSTQWLYVSQRRWM